MAVTGKDHTNVLATMVAKELGVTRAITKISREDYVLLAHKAGADAVVVPRMILAGTVLQMVRRSNLARVALLEDGKGEVLEFEVGPEAEVVGRPLSELPREKMPSSAAILRNGKAVIARGVSVIQPGDRVVRLCPAGGRARRDEEVWRQGPAQGMNHAAIRYAVGSLVALLALFLC